MSQPPPIRFNQPQLRFILEQPSSATNLWSRATGKSFVIAKLIDKLNNTMPRSKWLLVGETFKALLQNTLPSTVAGLAKLGYEREKNYFLNTRAPKKWQWPEPFEPPLNYQYCLHFPSGLVIQFISLDGNGTSARGLNSDGILGDEALNINWEKYDKEVYPTNRANSGVLAFKNIPYHQGEFFFSSMPYDLNSPLFEYGKYYEDKGIDNLTIQEHLAELQVQFLQEHNREHKLEAWKDVLEWQKRLQWFKNSEGYLYSEANVFDNIENVGLNYVQKSYRKTPFFLFKVEYLNLRPRKVEGGFYPKLSMARHAYTDAPNISQVMGDSRDDGDVMANEELIISVDWGSKINCLPIAQKVGREYRFVNAMYVKHPGLIQDLASMFTEYYRFHKLKKIRFLPDHWGNQNTPADKRTYNEQFATLLRQKGWTVNVVNRGKVPSPQDRYLLWSEILSGHDHIQVRFNKEKCKPLLIAMMQTKVREDSRGNIEKDKRGERKDIDQLDQPHFTDAADLHMVDVGSNFIRKVYSFMPTIIK